MRNNSKLTQSRSSSSLRFTIQHSRPSSLFPSFSCSALILFSFHLQANSFVSSSIGAVKVVFPCVSPLHETKQTAAALEPSIAFAFPLPFPQTLHLPLPAYSSPFVSFSFTSFSLAVHFFSVVWCPCAFLAFCCAFFLFSSFLCQTLYGHCLEK